MKTIIAALLLASLSAWVNAQDCDTRGWRQVDDRLSFYLDAHGKETKKDAYREYRKFECDGKWRYRVIDDKRRREV